MAMKKTIHSFRGMRKDISPSKVSSNYYIDAMNIRVTSNGKDSLYSITCEKYPELFISLNIKDLVSTNIEIKEDTTKIISHTCVNNNYLVLFLIIEFLDINDTQYIYNSIIRIDVDKNLLDQDADKYIVLFSGYKKTDINGNIFQDKYLNLGHTIDSLAAYETFNIQKVYWVDGVNQARVINIVADEETRRTWTSESFDFLQKLHFIENFNVEKLYQSGQFAPGVIQYCYTYFNMYGAETNIVDVSPLFFISDNNKGSSPENIVYTNCFKINIFNADPTFEFARVYSIHRSSLDAIPNVKIVKDIKVKEDIVIEDIISTQSRWYYTFNENIPNTEFKPIIDISLDGGNTFSSYLDDYAVDPNNIVPLDISGNKECSREDIVQWSAKIKNGGKAFMFSKTKYPDLFIKYGDYYYSYGNNSYGNTETIYIGISADFKYMVLVGEYAKNSSANIIKQDKIFKKEDEIIAGTSCIDNGIIGYNIDPSELLYKGGDFIIPKTLAQKDNTLFLGNIKLSESITNIQEIIEKYKDSINIEWKNSTKELEFDNLNLYPKIKLKSNIDSFRTFKYLETYRLGLQCQDFYGNWLDPIFLKDSKVTTSPGYTSYMNNNEASHNIKTVYGEIKLSADLIADLKKLGIVKCRPIVVYPTSLNREILCQGILNPTVYNTKQKYNKACDAQCSWIFRPQAYLNKEFISYPIFRESFLCGELYGDDDGTPPTFLHNNCNIFVDTNNTFNSKCFTEKGAWPEHKHNVLLPPNYSPNAELPNLQYSLDVTSEEYSIVSKNPSQSILGKYSGYEGTIGEDVDDYAINKNIITFHSPEIETREVEDIKNYKLRIIGAVTFNRVNKDYKVQVTNTNIEPDVHLDNDISNSKAFLQGSNIKNNVKHSPNAELLYDGVFNYDAFLFSGKVLSTGTNSEIKHQEVSNMFISNGTYYFNEYNNTRYIDCPTSDIQLFTGYNDQLILKSSANAVWKSSSRMYLYKGNYNEPLTAFKVHGTGSKDYFDFNFGKNGDFSNSSNYNFWNNVFSNSKAHYLYTGKYSTKFHKSYIISGKWDGEDGDGIYLPSDAYTSNDPIELSYKSTPHVAIVLDHINKGDYSTELILPRIDDHGSFVEYMPTRNFWNGTYADVGSFGGDGEGNINTKNYISEELFDLIKGNDSTHSRYLWLAELYQENTTKFEDSDSTNNLWYPAGEGILLNNNDSVVLKYTYGDTFFSRYDCLKTYPYNDSSTFNVVDIASFFVETRINTDLRWDNNRGLISNTHVSPDTFNKFNSAYNQINNFFNYRTVDRNISKNDLFPQTITWTKQKVNASSTDDWTHLNMSTTIDLDGSNGEISKIYFFNDDLYVFQPKSISRILFNTRALLNTSDGIPITLGSHYSLEGIKKISDIGASNIDCIKDNISFLYYTDPLTKGIYRFNGNQVENLSTKLNFSTWAEKNINNNSYVYSDHTNKNIYIFNEDKMLGYSEILGEFESFYGYAGKIIKAKDKSLLLETAGSSIDLYQMYYNNAGTYNIGESHITISHNDSSYLNKCYSHIESTADVIYCDSTTLKEDSELIPPFKNIFVENSYAEVEEQLNYSKYYPSNIKKKFNIWRIEFPRHDKNKRFNSPWVKIKLVLNREFILKKEKYPLDYEVHNLNINFIE